MRSRLPLYQTLPVGSIPPGSPSRDTANWLPSRFSLSVDTRRRYGWLRMVFPGALLSRTPVGALREVLRHARGRKHCRGEPGSYRVGTLQIRRRQRAARSSTSQDSAEPLCTRIKGSNQEVSEVKADVWPRYFFFLRGPTRSCERARFVGLVQGRTGLWTAGCWLARRLHQFKASTTVDLGISIFLILYDVWP